MLPAWIVAAGEPLIVGEVLTDVVVADELLVVEVPRLPLEQPVNISSVAIKETTFRISTLR